MTFPRKQRCLLQGKQRTEITATAESVFLHNNSRIHTKLTVTVWAHSVPAQAALPTAIYSNKLHVQVEFYKFKFPGLY